MSPHDFSSNRREIIAHTQIDVRDLEFTTASQAVVNPTNHCSVGCRHCLFSSKIQSNKREQLEGYELDRLIKILSQSGLRELVISGGGEPFENLPAVLRLIAEITSLENVVIITSAYFGSNLEDAGERIQAVKIASEESRERRGLARVSVTLRISRDASYVNTVSVGSVANVIITGRELFPRMQILLRTLSDDHSIQDLAQILGGRIMHPFQTAPIIDGIPCSWIRLPSNHDIPILIKPVYRTGRARNQASTINDVWAIIEEEKKRPQSFNLSLRGSRGEGHNFYGTHLLGFDYWKTTLGGINRYHTLGHESRVALALYCDATGSLGVNAGPPDNHINVRYIDSWGEFLCTIFRDPLLRELVKSGPLPFYELAKDVEPEVSEAVEKSNFVFSVSLYSMLTQSLRGYLTQLVVEDSNNKSDILQRKASLRELYKRASDEYHPALEISKRLDPIRGGVPTIFTK